MINYRVTLVYTNLDNSLYTDGRAELDVHIRATDYPHADLLALRLQKLHEADYFELREL